jgi:hypothetical protein
LLPHFVIAAKSGDQVAARRRCSILLKNRSIKFPRYKRAFPASPCRRHAADMPDSIKMTRSGLSTDMRTTLTSRAMRAWSFKERFNGHWLFRKYTSWRYDYL